MNAPRIFCRPTHPQNYLYVSYLLQYATEIAGTFNSDFLCPQTRSRHGETAAWLLWGWVAGVAISLVKHPTYIMGECTSPPWFVSSRTRYNILLRRRPASAFLTFFLVKKVTKKSANEKCSAPHLPPNAPTELSFYFIFYFRMQLKWQEHSSSIPHFLAQASRL
jgi:hypothetical protein